jgi:histidinol-phosphate phosphatase family protein
MGRAGILLDRDGTIIVDYHYVGVRERVQLIPGAAGAIARFNAAGIPVAIVTNQGGVARGFYHEPDVHIVHSYISKELALHDAHIDAFFYSPHHPDSFYPELAKASHDHKPNPGMAYRAESALDLDLTRSIVVGDRPEDVELASRIGAHAVYLGATPTTLDHVPFPSLAAAAGYIIRKVTGMSEQSFPSTPYTNASTFFADYTTELQATLCRIHYGHISKVCSLLIDTFRIGNSIFVAGNGGSAAIADHFTNDFIKYVSTDTEWYPRVTNLASHTALMTAISNDIGYDAIFSYQLERLAGAHDLLITFSVSGSSSNIVRALQYASEAGMTTVAITTVEDSKAAHIAGDTIIIPTSNYGIAEDAMNIIMHSVAQFIRQSRMSREAIESARF